MSGGVDSAVALVLAKKAFKTVFAVHMRNWDVLEEKGRCPGADDADDAAKICRAVGVPLLNVTPPLCVWFKAP